MAASVRTMLKRLDALEARLSATVVGGASASPEPVKLSLEALLPHIPEIVLPPPTCSGLAVLSSDAPPFTPMSPSKFLNPDAAEFFSQLHPRAVEFVPCLGKACDQDVGGTAVDRLLGEVNGSRHAQFGEWLPLVGAPAEASTSNSGWMPQAETASSREVSGMVGKLYESDVCNDLPFSEDECYPDLAAPEEEADDDIAYYRAADFCERCGDFPLSEDECYPDSATSAEGDKDDGASWHCFLEVIDLHCISAVSTAHLELARSFDV